MVRTGIGGMRTNQCFRQISCGVIPCIARMPTRILRRAARGYSGGAVAVPLVIINRPAGTATPATGITLKYTWYQRSGYLWRNFAPPRQSTPCSTEPTDTLLSDDLPADTLEPFVYRKRPVFSCRKIRDIATARRARSFLEATCPNSLQVAIKTNL